MSQTPATAQPISPLRRRMIEDMTVRRIGEKTQSDYIRHVKNFSLFLARSPHTATPEDLRAFQVHQSAAGVQPPTMNSTMLCFAFGAKLGNLGAVARACPSVNILSKPTEPSPPHLVGRGRVEHGDRCPAGMQQIDGRQVAGSVRAAWL